MSFLSELKRRHVVQVGLAYLVIAWGAAQVADLLLGSFDIEAWVMQLTLLVLASGFPVTLVLAWVYEVRGDGIHRERELVEENDQPESKVTSPSRSIHQQSIAVLPFVNMSDDSSNEYFSEGISEELLDLLARVPELRVAARTSSFSFKGSNKNIQEIGRELHVAHVLEGSVRKAGNKVRITAQLIRVNSGFHLWSNTWNRSLDDIFAVQTEIAAEVVNQLKLKLLVAAPEVDDTTPEAYTLYLQARHLARQGTADGYVQSIVLLDKVLALDHDFAPGWNLLATNYLNQGGMGLRSMAESFKLARESAYKALDSDVDYGPTHATLAWMVIVAERDLMTAAAYLTKALDLEPANPDTQRRAAVLLNHLGRLDSAIALEEWILTLDPINPAIHHNLGLSYYYAGRYDSAIASWRTVLKLFPGRLGAHFSIGCALLMLGDVECAVMEMQNETSEVHRLIGLTLAYAGVGQIADSDASLAILIKKYAEDAAINIAYALAYREEPDRTFIWLEKAVENCDPGLSEVATEPLFFNVHSDPRWLTFLESIGMAPEQLAAINFEVEPPY